IGKRADIAIWDANCLENAGSWDPAALLLAGPTKVKHLIVDGRMIVEDGQLLSVDLPRLIDHQRKLAEALVG
ncbi:MAG: 8-oxoguanine deaminase, partial [Rhodobacteraceae bacterium]|nr:8-oxoguanine deaminase [Paracoccaceae bacterium]